MSDVGKLVGIAIGRAVGAHRHAGHGRGEADAGLRFDVPFQAARVPSDGYGDTPVVPADQQGDRRRRARCRIASTDQPSGSRSMSVGAAENGCFFAAEAPLLHTVEEAAGVLRIGRTLAYELARRYEASGGVAGLPVIRLGSCLRVPRWALLELARTGRVVALCELVADVAELLSGPDDSTPVDRSGELDQLLRCPVDRNVGAESPEALRQWRSSSSSSRSAARPAPVGVGSTFRQSVPAAARRSEFRQVPASGREWVPGRCCG